MRAIRIVFALLCTLGASFGAIAADVNLGKQFESFTVPGGPALDVYYCAWNDRAACSPPKRFASGATGACSDATFGDPKPGVIKLCWGVAVAAPTTVVAKLCYPEPQNVKLGFAGWSADNYKVIAVPAEVQSTKPNFGYWQDCSTKKHVGQYFTDADFAKLVAAYVLKQLGSSDAVNAWTATQPQDSWSAGMKTYARQVLDAKDAELQRKCVITPIPGGATDRPVLLPTADGTKMGKTVSGVRSPAGTVVPCSPKIGDYYNVAGTKDTLGRVISAGFSVGAVQ